MNRNYIPKYKYDVFRKNDPEFKSLADTLAAVTSFWSKSKQRLIKAYSDQQDAITTVVMTNEIVYEKKIDYKVESKIKDASKIQVRENGYHKLVDITLQAIPTEGDRIVIKTLDDDIVNVRAASEEFQKLEQFHTLLSKVKAEEIIANIVFDLCNEFKLTPFHLHIHSIICHPVDTKPIFIYEAVIKIFTQILGLETAVVKRGLEDKLSDYEFLFSEMNPLKLDFLKSNGNNESDGMRLVYYNKELNPNAILHKTVAFNDPVAQRIKRLLLETKQSDIAAPCVPVYRDAIVFRDEIGEIVGYFNICFACMVIESHNLTQMPVTMYLMEKLSNILDATNGDL